MFEVHCNLCSGNFILDNKPNASWSCICQNKPKNMPYSILLKCSKGHRMWARSRDIVCLECQKERTIEIAKKLLEIQSQVNHKSIEKSIVETNKILHTNKEEFYKKFYKKKGSWSSSINPENSQSKMMIFQ
jgi:hypothetical protein